MKTKQIRNLAFYLHRYLGLVLGLLLIFIGITGSLLIFEREIESFIVNRQYGNVAPQEQTVSLNRVVENAQTTYPDWDIEYIKWSKNPRKPITLRMVERDVNPNIYMDGEHQVFIDPYTGKVLGDRVERYTYYRFLLNLHYRLFVPGDTGVYITGVAGLLLLIISVTGIYLWSGWRRLVSGFKINLNASTKRANYDIHKVAGIIAAVFLLIIAFTGVCWNFEDISYPLINALTFSPEAEEISIKLLPNKNRVQPSVILASAQQALPTMIPEFFSYPYEASDPFYIYGTEEETVAVDPYTAEVLKIELPQETSLGDRITNAFFPLHNGMFGGLPTRILYVFIGLSPTVLFITGFTMYRLRRRPRLQTNVNRELIQR